MLLLGIDSDIGKIDDGITLIGLTLPPFYVCPMSASTLLYIVIVLPKCCKPVLVSFQ